MKDNEQKIGDIKDSDLHKVNTYESNDAQNNRPYKAWTVILIVVSICLLAWNILYTSVRFPNPKNLGFDYSGVIVTILSLLITILIAWQIIHYFHFINNIKNELQEQITNTRKDFDKQIFAIRQDSELQARNGIGIALIQIACLLYDAEKEKETNNRITLFRSGFVLFCNGLTLTKTKSEITSEARSEAIPRLKSICEFFKNKGIIIHDPEFIFIKAAIETNDKELILLMSVVTIQPESDK